MERAPVTPLFQLFLRPLRRLPGLLRHDRDIGIQLVVMIRDAGETGLRHIDRREVPAPVKRAEFGNPEIGQIIVGHGELLGTWPRPGRSCFC